MTDKPKRADELKSEGLRAILDLCKNMGISKTELDIAFLENFSADRSELVRFAVGTPSALDTQFNSNPKTKRPEFAKHGQIEEWIRAHIYKPGLRVSEIGSRRVTSAARFTDGFPDVEYVGLDVQEGWNVDCVGDAHKLSDYFEPNSFDLVISFAVFEHLAMPWIVAEEITKVLADDGHVIIETHFSFKEHEQPWHYFQFNSNALEILFCPEFGYELIDSGLDSPMIGRFSYDAAEYLRGTAIGNLYCHSSIIARKVGNARDADHAVEWRKLIGRITSESSYPMESDQKRQHSSRNDEGDSDT